MEHVYPVSAGSKVDGASRAVARMVDADPERKLNVQVAIVLESILDQSLCIDEIAVNLGESFFYIRPRCSELVSLGVLEKGPRKIGISHGRSAHTVWPSGALVQLLHDTRAHELELDGLRIVIRRFILDRVMDAKINGGARV